MTEQKNKIKYYEKLSLSAADVIIIIYNIVRRCWVFAFQKSFVQYLCTIYTIKYNLKRTFNIASENLYENMYYNNNNYCSYFYLTKIIVV